jgi:hypothetical protein
LLQQRQALLQQQLHKVLTEGFALPQRYRGVLLFKLPVRPPSRAETDAWLLAQQASQGTRTRGSRGRASAAAAVQQGIRPYGATGMSGAAPAAGGGVSAVGSGRVQRAQTQLQRGIPAAAAPTQAAPAAADFRMDANTGRLVPVLSTGLAAAHSTPGMARSGLTAAAAALAAATAAAAGGGSGYGGYGPSTQVGVEIEAELGLLSTPLLLSVPSQPQQQQLQLQLHRTQSMPTASLQMTHGAAIDTQPGRQQQQGSGQLRLQLSADSQHKQEHTTAAAAAAGLPPPSGGHHPAFAAGPSHELEECSDDIEVSSDGDFEAPASPKYDERSFFFSAAAARSSARIRSGSRSQRRHSATFSTPAAPAAVPIPAAGDNVQGGVGQPVSGKAAGGARGAQAGAGGQPGYQRIHEQLKQAARRRSSAAGGGGAAAAPGSFSLPGSTPRAGPGAGSPDADSAAAATAAGAATSSGGARTPPKGTAPPSLRLPGHTEHITPPTAAMVQTPASKAAAGGPAAAVRGASAGKAPSQLGFKQQRGSQGSGKEGGAVPELRLAAVEVHADSRGSLLPDPR